ncbi:MAG: acyl-CoA dehydrogenase family protein [Deltaproteobacteria bacterium]|nr:acyl-CoA dehydrogenase family protein [Deltaproteobacteria bacterium]MBW1949278.1 acyl-CoA dehydrogenase family protein [Deltaproteobacteria bacterium]MBW2007712.1 acyl-CoA dehydrogenase family protein [Deltaproteobacteria bacterium]MBW2103844.1 acyl-CoA dehydrogenase family protein [Deltaproteobacteria bacterium]MBW2347254.1 acyl-CoA dehydrogenase family protein [Deltaproteobacteria bacterium]
MEIPEEHRMIVETVRKFTEKEIVPLADKMDRENYWPGDLFPRLGELGVLGPTVPEQYGGIGSDPLAQVLITEELAKGSAGVALSHGAHSNLCTHNLHANANERQRERYLPSLCSGEKVGALGLTEPGAGSDAVGIRTTAVHKGDVYVLNGSKMFITNAPIADVMIIYAKTDPGAGSRGITAFIVESGFPGYSVSGKMDKLGHRCSPTGEVILEDCVVPAENVLGKVNKGVAVMMAGLDIERVMVAGLALGIAEAAFDASLRYAREREQFGKPIAHFQLIQAKLADMYTNIEAARLLTYDVAVRTARESRLRKESAASVLFAAEMGTRVCLEAVQIHGGYGYMLEFPVNRYLRDAKLLEIGAGTSEIRRLLIARELLK